MSTYNTVDGYTVVPYDEHVRPGSPPPGSALRPSIQCDTGMKQGEEYVKHLMCGYVSEYIYGIIARFALMDLGSWV